MIQNTSASHLQVRWLVIVNPRAGSGNIQEHWPLLKSRIAELLPLAEFQVSTARGAATALVAAAVSQGIRHIMAVGGDGMAHQVVNAIMQQSTVPSTAITFALLPCGTGNDWIKSHGIPRAWPAWRAAFLNGNIHQQNLGQIEFTNRQAPRTVYFLNVAGLAYDAYVVRYLQNRHSALPARLFYFWATFRCLFQYTPPWGSLVYNGKTVTRAFYTINVGIGRFSGGGMQFVPHAQPDGPDLALTFVEQVSRLAVIVNSFRFYGGRIASYQPAVLAHTTRVEVLPQGEDKIAVEADGEFLGESPVVITLVSGALRFVGK
ncbi:MAG: hypothetical protein DA408_17715 [Bacteroidetes bacterium]|nr:MAG: hypothetical protein DA408_17715 [Bacteroidota bacterium]